MERITDTDKWKDAWFCTLSPKSKLLFIYLYENCNAAGILEMNYDLMKVLLNFDSNKDVITHLGKIKRCFIPNKSKTKIWVKNYLFHQNKLPLDKGNIHHREIILMIEKNCADFNNAEEMLFILDKIEKAVINKKSTRKVFKKPNLDEWKAYYKTLGDFEETEMLELFDYYESCGWKIGSKPMVDWKASVRNALRRKKPDKFEVMNSVTDIDYENLGK